MTEKRLDQRKLATTLEVISSEGSKAFHDGEIARALVGEVDRPVVIGVVSDIDALAPGGGQ